MPTLVQDLNATASELQWIVDSNVLLFAGLLLTMGPLGDRFGRKLARGTPLGNAYMRKVMAPRLAALGAALRRAEDRGDLREDLDVEIAVASIVGPMMFLVLTGRIANLDEGLAGRLVDQAIGGMKRNELL